MTPPEDQFVIPWFKRAYVGSGLYRLYFPDLDRSVVAPDTAADAMARSCGVLLPRETWQILIEPDILADLWRQSCLIPASEILHRGAREASLPECLIAICTRNRPDLLETCLRGLRFRARSTRAGLTVAVIDSSTAPVVVAQNSALVAEMSKDANMPLQHVVASTFDAMIGALGFDCATRSAAKYACTTSRQDIVTTGASRNIASILSSGRLLLFIDDDVDLGEIYVRADYDGDLAVLSPHGKPDIYRLPLDSTGIGSLVHVDIPDFLDQCLEQIQASGSVVLSRYHRVEVGRLDRPTLAGLLEGGPVIDSVSCGHVGDCGFGDLMPFLDASVLSAAHFAGRYHPRNAIVASSSCLTTRDPFFMTLCSVVDNRRLLPPYFPIGRGHDSLFMILHRVTEPASMTAHLPYIVKHRIGPDSSGRPQLMGCQVRTSDLMSVIIQHLGAPLRETDPSTALAFIAAGLDALGKLSDRSVDEWLRDIWREWAGRTLETLESAPQETGSCHALSTEEKDEIRRALAEIFKSKTIVGQAVDAPDGRAYAPEEFRGELRSFAALLYAWPCIRKGAALQEVRAAG